MENQRAIRRAEAARLKKNRAHWWGRKLSGKEKGRALNTATICSCCMCGNARKHWGERTMQERRQMQDIER